MLLYLKPLALVLLIKYYINNTPTTTTTRIEMNTHAFSYPNETNFKPDSNVPISWNCSDLKYDSRDGCHCECGTYDPDCDIPNQKIRCTNGFAPRCNRNTNMCEYGPVQENWICAPRYYDRFDGCDCNCGQYDPDCDPLRKQITHGCDSSTKPWLTGRCSNETFMCETITTAEPIPDAWVCEWYKYGSGDGCDCNCGVYDPDCTKQGAIGTVQNCPCEDMTCSLAGICVGTCNGVTVILQPPLLFSHRSMLKCF